MDEPKLFRCRICGEVYFGKHPSHCPHCGAHVKYMVLIKGWKDENKDVSLSDISRKNLKTTKDLEFHASRLYRGAAGESGSDEIKGFFKYLARVEKEHYEVACKLLGENISDEINGKIPAKGNDTDNLAESKRLEEHATKLYREFADKAEEYRVKDYFEALADIESDHIDLDTIEISKLDKERGTV